MVTSMLEKAIEIEGLLRIIRDGNPQPETYILLQRKAARLAEEASSFSTGQTGGAGESHADFVMTSPTAEPTPTEEVTFGVEKGRSDLALDEEDDIILSFDDNTDATTDTETGDLVTEQEFPIIEAREEEATEPSSDKAAEAKEDPAPQDETTVSEDHREEGTILLMEEKAFSEPSAEETPATEEVFIKALEEPILNERKQKGKLRSAFSLNDRFLYARELFNGNMKMFDSTIEFLEGIDDYSVIEEYFYNELGWDAEKPYVGQFMEIIHGRGTQL